jgi:hypothetical protein
MLASSTPRTSLALELPSFLETIACMRQGRKDEMRITDECIAKVQPAALGRLAESGIWDESGTTRILTAAISLPLPAPAAGSMLRSDQMERRS